MIKQTQCWIALILGLSSVYFSQPNHWNSNSRLNLIRAIVEQGRFQIDTYHDQPGWETGDKALLQGHVYSDKAIGSSLLGVIPYSALYWGFLRWLGALPPRWTAWLLTAAVMGPSLILVGLLLFRLALRLSGDAAAAAATALIATLGSMLWPYSTLYYGHVPAAALLCLAFVLLVDLRHTPARNDWLRAAVSGAAAGGAVLTEYPAAVPAAILAGYGAWALIARSPRERIRLGGAALLGAAIPALLFFGYNLAVYGRLLGMGYLHEVETEFQQVHQTGLWGLSLPDPAALYRLTLDPQRGLFWLSPVLWLIFVGSWAGLKASRYRTEILVSLGAAVGLLFFNAGYAMWWGGWAFGPRHLIPALPFLALPLVFIVRRWPLLTTLLAFLSAANMLIALLGVVEFPLGYDSAAGAYQSVWLGETHFEGISLLYQLNLINVLLGNPAQAEPWNWGMALFGLKPIASVLPLWAAQAALLFLVFRSAHEASKL
jgi:hypothetical protein